MYNESDPNVDRKERDEEMERMREHVLKSVSRKQDKLFRVVSTTQLPILLILDR